jgi:cytochrome c553
MYNKTLAYLLGIIILSFSSVSIASHFIQNTMKVERGQELVTTQCFACHGIDGISLIDIYPNLRGQKEKYLIKQLTAFKDGTRVDLIMGPMASILTDEDINAVSKYLSELE